MIVVLEFFFYNRVKLWWILQKISNNYNKIRLYSKENIENTINIMKNEISIGNANIVCETGVYGQKLENHNFTVTGIDKVESQIKQVSKKDINNIIEYWQKIWWRL